MTSSVFAWGNVEGRATFEACPLPVDRLFTESVTTSKTPGREDDHFGSTGLHETIEVRSALQNRSPSASTEGHARRISLRDAGSSRQRRRPHESRRGLASRSKHSALEARDGRGAASWIASDKHDPSVAIANPERR
jgi:hypothetical protein